jgi:hypothetical protein
MKDTNEKPRQNCSKIISEDRPLLTVLLSASFWFTVLFSVIATGCADNVLSAEETDMSTPPLYHFNPRTNERTSLLPPSYSDCETPPPCYSQAVKMAGGEKEPLTPTYQDL